MRAEPELNSLVRLLVSGNLRTRRRLADRLSRAEGGWDVALLAGTVRSQDAWKLRARALEVLGLAAGSADQHIAELILDALLQTPSSRDG